MGVSFLKSFENEEPTNKLRKVEKNQYTGYRNNAVYRECSYSIRDFKKSSQNSKKRMGTSVVFENNKPAMHDKFSWTKIYRSPIPLRSSKNSIAEINKKTSVTKTENTIEMENLDTINNKEITTQGYMTSSSEEKSSIHLRKSFCSKIMPKLMCPCCGGGDDNIERCDMPYNRQRTTDSYESIDLTHSSTCIPIDLDASLMSILCLRRLNQQRLPTIYSKMLITMLRNTCKNIVSIFSFKKVQERMPVQLQ